MAKMLNVSCPACHTINTMEKAFIGWKNNTCANCGAKLKASEVDDNVQIVVCASCHKSVAWDPRRGDNCPSCGKDIAQQQSERAIACPGCGVAVRYQEGDHTHVTCPVCRQSFDPVARRAEIEGIMTSPATDIQMPVNAMKPGEIIWHHPNHQFAVNARVIAAPGMQAVLVQGGTPVAVVDGQSVRLSETSLKHDAWSYEGAAEKMVNVDVYYVRTRFNSKFPFGSDVTLQMPYDRAATVPYFGECTIVEVTDAGAFLNWVGYNTNGTVDEKSFSSTTREVNGEKILTDGGKIRDEVLRDVAPDAMRQVCAEYGVQPNQLHQYTPQVMQHISRMANERLKDMGLRVSVGGTCKVSEATVSDYDDPLKKNLRGMIEWETAPFLVHAGGKVMATASVQVKGSMSVSISNEVALNRSLEVSEWRETPAAAKNAIRAYVQNNATARCAAVIQQIIDDKQLVLHMLHVFNPVIGDQVAYQLNQQGEFFHRHGLMVENLNVSVRIIERSQLLEELENSAALPDLLALKAQASEMQREYATRDYIHSKQDEVTRFKAGHQAEGEILISSAELEDLKTELEIKRMQNTARIGEAERQINQSAIMQDLANKHQIDETIRRYSFEAWRDQQALADQQMAAEMNRARAQQQHRHATKMADAVHEADLERLAQEVGLSKLSFREKMDAYARIQRNLAFQDQLDQNVASSHADADNEAYAANLALKLNESSAKVMQTLDYEQKLHEEDLQKARFAREMEKRRQEVAEEMARLNAEFERERAMAAEAEQRRKSENEVETLKLMLEFLAKDSENQVTAARMQAAREQAERSWQQHHADQERQQAAARRQEQQAAEQQMADRAYELVQQMNAMQHELDKMKLENERAYNQGRAMVDARGPMYQQSQMDALKAQMENLQNAVKTLGAQVAQAAPAGGIGKAFAGMVDQVRNAFTGAGAQPQTGYGSAPQQGYGYGAAPAYGQGVPAYGQSTANYGMQPGMQGVNTCRSCGTKYSVGLGCCPNCGAK